MAQIICIGDSMSYGVGSTIGGWPDLLKHELHRRMYIDGGEGHAHEVYNLAIPRQTVEEVAKHIATEVAARTHPPEPTIIVLSLGTNDSKAKDNPNGFISTPEDYQRRLTELLQSFAQQTENIIAYGLTPVDEKRTSPHSGAYFSNQRIKLFENYFKLAADSARATFVPLFDDALMSKWTEQCLYNDGLHPNSIGQQWLYEKIAPSIQQLL